MSHANDEHHIVPFKVNLKVFLVLIALTIITVYTARHMHFGVLNLVVAMLIASLKVFVVMGWFMHLRYEGYLHKLIVAIAVMFVILLYGLSAIDVFSRMY